MLLEVHTHTYVYIYIYTYSNKYADLATLLATSKVTRHCEDRKNDKIALKAKQPELGSN